VEAHRVRRTVERKVVLERKRHTAEGLAVRANRERLGYE
jgi:hypothetical protein